MSDIKLGILLWSQAATYAEMLDAARLVDRLGYAHLWTWDHVYAIFGDPHQPIFEGWSLLNGWARETERTRLGLLVGANTFRNPGIVAKSVATLDHASNGRAILGVGGAWMEPEHTAHGIDFGSGFGQRLDWLDESVGAMRGLLDGKTVTLGAGRPLCVPGRPAPARPGPGPPADHDRGQRREEDAPDGRPLRRHVERDGVAGADDPQDRGPARPLRRGRARHRRDRVHVRAQGHDPRYQGGGRSRLGGRDGPQPDADGRRRRRSDVLERHARGDRGPDAPVRRARLPDVHLGAPGAVRHRVPRAVHRRGRAALL